MLFISISTICILRALTPDTWVDGELFLEQSSELEEEVEVGVMGTALLLAGGENTTVSVLFRCSQQ